MLVFLIILAFWVFIKFSMDTGGFRDNLKSFFLNSYYNNPFFENSLRFHLKQSEVNASLVDSELTLNFEIIEDDKLAFQNFVNNWFGVREEIKSIKVGIDESVIQVLTPILPAKLNLTVKDKSLDFKNQPISVLQTAMTGTEINFATGSGKFKLKYSNPTQYQIRMENPAELALYATNSGMLTASSKIDGLFKSLPQVATIELSVGGKNISGQIVLK